MTSDPEPAAQSVTVQGFELMARIAAFSMRHRFDGELNLKSLLNGTERTAAAQQSSWSFPDALPEGHPGEHASSDRISTFMQADAIAESIPDSSTVATLANRARMPMKLACAHIVGGIYEVESQRPVARIEKFRPFGTSQLLGRIDRCDLSN